VFPRLALGLSGFETGVAVMPLVKGNPTDTARLPDGRIRHTQKLLTSAALIMSGFLMTTSFVTTLLIPHEEFEEGGEASGRALAFLAHDFFGDGFGTAYDISTILILWFAGASAMAGLLNIVPRYLPRYGMAPDWAHATRPLVLVFTLVAFTITVIFRANVEAQAGAYATGVLVLISSASVAVTLAARKARQRWLTWVFGAIALVFVYTTVVNVIERPDGIKIAGFFIAAIVIVSLVSRAVRSTELRTTAVDFDDEAERLVNDMCRRGTLRIIANHPDERNTREYLLKERGERDASHIPMGDPVVFLEVTVRDASEFASQVHVYGEEIGGFRVLRAEGTAVPNTIAAVLLAIRDQVGKRPHAYFGWVEGNPLKYLARFIFFGEGDIAPTTREILRQAEPDPGKRPVVHVG
nr:amino acid transporter [Chloroflexia bacterium]